MLKQYKHAQGLTMLEMLVALVVLSVGLIGVAALQMRGQQFNYFAYVRTQATFLAYDLMDRMRINEDAAYQGLYQTQCTSLEEKNCVNTSCSPTDLAGYDLAQWCQLLELLPEGRAIVNFENNTYEINLFWVESREEEQILASKSRQTCGLRETRDSCQSWTFSPSPPD